MPRITDDDIEKQESLLMKQIANKDRKAFEKLYFNYSPRIGKFLWKLLKGPEFIDEVVNEVMLTVWQNAEHFDASKSKLSTWLFGIAHNKALKLLERQRKYQVEESFSTEETQHEDEWDVAPASLEEVDPNNPERTVLGWEIGDLLVWALEQLSFEHRTVLELAINEEYAYQDIAKIIDCPVNTVKTRMFHARKKLAEIFAQKGYALNEFGGIR